MNGIKLLSWSSIILSKLSIVAFRNHRGILNRCIQQYQYNFNRLLLRDRSINAKRNGIAHMQNKMKTLLATNFYVGIIIFQKQHDLLNKTKSSLDFVALFDVTSNPEVNEQILTLIQTAETHILNENLPAAKYELNKALAKAYSATSFAHVNVIFDYLIAIAILEGSVIEVEDNLINFIETVIQMGMSETDNLIVKYRLKLSRLYQYAGNYDMADMGFRNCISVLEENLQKAYDETTHTLYLCSLFWYGRYLSEQMDLSRSKTFMLKTLDQIHKSTYTSVNQLMVVLFYTAEVCFKLEQYDEAIIHLIEAIDLTKNNQHAFPDLPIYFVKLGVAYLYKGAYNQATFWCANGCTFAKNIHDVETEQESLLCLEKIDEWKKRDQIK